MQLNKKFIFSLFVLFLFSTLTAQEALLSVEESYFDMLALDGVIERPTMNYRTLSDSVWNIQNLTQENSIWYGNKLTTDYTFFDTFNVKVYSPDLYISNNSASPYGINDGGMWQGKGLNAAFTAGAAVQAYGVSLVFKPQISFSQNKQFDFPNPAYSGTNYSGKAGTYGDYSLGSVDAPQRFGENSFWNFDWGDTEIRYTWKTLTLGFGTQNIWLGPAQVLPIIHSNNAQSYPKLDFGIRNQPIYIKDLWLGNIEFRYWWGKLSESDYFDNDTTNNNNLITGLAIAYELPFLPGLRVGLNRTMLSPWTYTEKKDLAYCMWELLIPYMRGTAGWDQSDQRASFVAEYFIPKGGISLYLEWGKNDYNSGLDNIIRFPFHTQAITAGFKKNVNYKNNKFKGQFLFEISTLEGSMDYYFFYDWGNSGNNFYTHHIRTQGYTNRGQYLGAGIGSGGNSQYVSYKFYYPKGETTFFAQRTNPDLNYYYYVAQGKTSKPKDYKKSSICTTFDLGLSSTYYFTPNLRGGLTFVFDDIHNPLLKNDNFVVDENYTHAKFKSEHRYNIVTQVDIKYYF